MIIDTLSNFEQYISLIPSLKHIIQFLNGNPLATLAPGAYEIYKDSISLNLKEYDTKEERVIEIHQKTIELQLIANGSEQVGWNSFNHINPIGKYNAEKDVWFVEGPTQKVVAIPELFFVFLPNEAHQYGLQNITPCAVKKAIIKIRL